MVCIVVIWNGAVKRLVVLAVSKASKTVAVRNSVTLFIYSPLPYPARCLESPVFYVVRHSTLSAMMIHFIELRFTLTPTLSGNSARRKFSCLPASTSAKPGLTQRSLFCFNDASSWGFDSRISAMVTSATPSSIIPRSSAAASDKSIATSGSTGPRSVTLTFVEASS